MSYGAPFGTDSYSGGGGGGYSSGYSGGYSNAAFGGAAPYSSGMGYNSTQSVFGAKPVNPAAGAFSGGIPAPPQAISAGRTVMLQQQQRSYGGQVGNPVSLISHSGSTRCTGTSTLASR